MIIGVADATKSHLSLKSHPTVTIVTKANIFILDRTTNFCRE